MDEYDPINVLGLAMFSRPGSFGAGHFDDPVWWRRVQAANSLTAPARYAAFGSVELGLMRRAVPWASFETTETPAFFSARVGCVGFTPYGVDLAALCIRHT